MGIIPRKEDWYLKYIHPIFADLLKLLAKSCCHQDGAQESSWENLTYVVKTQRRVLDHHWSSLKQEASWSGTWQLYVHSCLTLGQEWWAFCNPNGCWGRHQGDVVPKHCWKCEWLGQELRGTISSEFSQKVQKPHWRQRGGFLQCSLENL